MKNFKEAKTLAIANKITVILKSDFSNLIYTISPCGEIKVANLGIKLDNLADTFGCKYQVVNY